MRQRRTLAILGVLLAVCETAAFAAPSNKLRDTALQVLLASHTDTGRLSSVEKVDGPAHTPPIRLRVIVDPTKLASGGLSSISGRAEDVNPSGTQQVTVVREDIDADELRRLVDMSAVRAIEIVRPPVIGPVINRVTPRDVNSRHSHRVDEWATDPDLQSIDGTGVRALIIDEGAVRASHVEFRADQTRPASTRVTKHTTSSSTHSTHVAGDLCAAGRRADAKGIAPAAIIESDDWNDDIRKLLDYATNLPVVSISNHSYGHPAGWDGPTPEGWYWWGSDATALEDSRFGKYTSSEADLDRVLSSRPALITFVAAGNDRNDGPEWAMDGGNHYVIGVVNNKLQWVLSSAKHEPDGYDHGGLDTVNGLGLAKNSICIGSIADVTSGHELDVESYSDWGPTDDGRVKPDLVANGQMLTAPSDSSDQAYVAMSGTSMASPTAAGIGALLVQLYKKTRGADPTAAEIKAAMIHTATTGSQHPGPDPRYGWGSIDSYNAAMTILGKNGFRLSTGSVGPAAPNLYTFKQDGGSVRVTAVWSDPPAPANTGGLDDATPTLQNDLDVTLTDPNGAVHYPYRLNMSDPDRRSIADGPNRVDNVEVIDAPAMDGRWTVQIKAASLKSGANQTYALATSGLTPAP